MAKGQDRDLWVSKKDQTLAGVKVNIGQIIQPAGSRNDHLIFNDHSYWAGRHVGGDPIPCGSDGCPAEFNSLGNLERHRELVHKPERDSRERARVAAKRAEAIAEDRGEAIGGYPITKVKKGPGGDVPYIEPYAK